MLISSNNARQQGVFTASFPAPTGGWNARDPIAQMNPLDAVIMKNWMPKTGSIKVRDGKENFVTGFGSAVESLMVYNAADGTQEMYAASNNAFYDVSSSGALGAAVVTGLTNARWNYVNFTNTSAISYLCAFNGVDSPQYWNGSSWITITGASSPAITGVTTSNLKNPWQHKRRMWMIESGTLSAWYLPVDSVGGAATEFALYGLFQKGGSLVAGGTWSVDGGEGLDDYIIFVTTEGEVAIYQGTNPGSDFVIKGVWNIGEPIGERCLIKYGGDLLIITVSGVYPLSRALQSTEIMRDNAITGKIDGAMNDAAISYRTNFGWELTRFPLENMLILNVPVVENTTTEQYVMNMITGSWGRFTDLNGICFAVYNRELYMGTADSVQKYGATSDNGAEINADVLPAFNYFQSANQKQFSMVRPYINTNGVPNVLAALNVDFDTDSPSAPLTFTAPNVFTWDVSNWDEAVWSGGFAITKEWATVNGVGVSASLRLLVATAGVEVELQAIEYSYEVGGVI